MSVLDTALRDALRALKLSGMLETLDARLAQAHAGELGHLDFLQVLCHDEIARRDPGGPVRAERDAGGVRLPRQPQAARRADPGPGGAALARRR